MFIMLVYYKLIINKSIKKDKNNRNQKAIYE